MSKLKEEEGCYKMEGLDRCNNGSVGSAYRQP